jgi:hypothetical protein
MRSNLSALVFFNLNGCCGPQHLALAGPLSRLATTRHHFTVPKVAAHRAESDGSMRYHGRRSSIAFGAAGRNGWRYDRLVEEGGESVVSIETHIAGHYTQGTLEQRILAALREAGKDPDRLDPDDLAPVDEFHHGGRAATAAFAPRLALRPGIGLLEIGSGIGGPARYFARHHGCRVTGIDLTEEFIAVSRALTRRLGMESQVCCEQGSALSMPFPASTFDVATLLHVGMNIAEKACLFAEVRRVLRTLSDDSSRSFACNSFRCPVV